MTLHASRENKGGKSGDLSDPITTCHVNMCIRVEQPAGASVQRICQIGQLALDNEELERKERIGSKRGCKELDQGLH